MRFRLSHPPTPTNNSPIGICPFPGTLVHMAKSAFFTSSQTKLHFASGIRWPTTFSLSLGYKWICGIGCIYAMMCVCVCRVPCCMPTWNLFRDLLPIQFRIQSIALTVWACIYVAHRLFLTRARPKNGTLERECVSCGGWIGVDCAKEMVQYVEAGPGRRKYNVIRHSVTGHNFIFVQFVVLLWWPAASIRWAHTNTFRLLLWDRAKTCIAFANVHTHIVGRHAATHRRSPALHMNVRCACTHTNTHKYSLWLAMNCNYTH